MFLLELTKPFDKEHSGKRSSWTSSRIWADDWTDGRTKEGLFLSFLSFVNVNFGRGDFLRKKSGRGIFYGLGSIQYTTQFWTALNSCYHSLAEGAFTIQLLNRSFLLEFWTDLIFKFKNECQLDGKNCTYCLQAMQCSWSKNNKIKDFI